MPLRLTLDVKDALLAAARASGPRECVGLVVGPSMGVGREIVPMSNVSADGDGFAVDPLAHVSTRRAIRRRGLVVVAVYHSHPHGDPIPSRRDVDGWFAGDAPLFPNEALLVVAGAQVVVDGVPSGGVRMAAYEADPRARSLVPTDVVWIQA